MSFLCSRTNAAISAMNAAPDHVPMGREARHSASSFVRSIVLRSFRVALESGLGNLMHAVDIPKDNTLFINEHKAKHWDDCLLESVVTSSLAY